jgi:hypothetical protein
MMHEIFYAYPYSDVADIVGGRGFIVKHNDELKRFTDYQDAHAYAQGLGTDPDYLSLDHPNNDALLKKAELTNIYHQR